MGAETFLWDVIQEIEERQRKARDAAKGEIKKQQVSK